MIWLEILSQMITPKSMTKLSKQVNRTITATRNALKNMEECGLVTYEKNGVRKLYSTTDKGNEVLKVMTDINWKVLTVSREPIEWED